MFLLFCFPPLLIFSSPFSLFSGIVTLLIHLSGVEDEEVVKFKGQWDQEINFEDLRDKKVRKQKQKK